MFKLSQRLAISIFLLFFLPRLSSPLSASDPEPSVFLEDFLSARFRLRNGHFIVKGVFPNIPTSGESHLEVWFDSDNWLGKLTNQTPFDNSGKTTTVLLNDKGCYVHVGGSEVLQCDRKSAMRYVGYFDVRSIGIALAAEMDAGSSVGEIIRSKGMKQYKTELLRNANDNVVIRRGPLPGGCFLVYEIDAARGFTPVSAQFRKDATEMQQHASCKWAQLDGEWVPLKFELVLNEKVRSHLSFEWTEVNKAYPSGFFELRSVFPGNTRFIQSQTDGAMRWKNVDKPR